MLRRDLVNMRACAAHVSERCPSCMYLAGVPQFIKITALKIDLADLAYP